MNEIIASAHKHQSISTATAVMVAALASASIGWPAPVQKAYQDQLTIGTYSGFAGSLRFTREMTESEFTRRVADVYANLLATQQPLEGEFERVLMDGLGQLYEE
jgi:hypothetical protein